MRAITAAPPSLGAAFDPRNNSLNALRLVFASMVIVSHAWPLGGFGRDPQIGGIAVGRWAVAGFFVISGYLIASSRGRTPFLTFLWRRFLRIFPGLWVCLLVTVLVFVRRGRASEWTCIRAASWRSFVCLLQRPVDSGPRPASAARSAMCLFRRRGTAQYGRSCTSSRVTSPLEWRSRSR